jgi:hypothetical protein
MNGRPDYGSANSTDGKAEVQSNALYVNENELHRRIAPHIGRDAFRSAIKTLEDQHSFPKVNALFRGRYWPSVKSWLNRYNGVGDDVFATQAEDGEENFNEAPREKSRSQVEQARQSSAAVLGRESSRAGHSRIS